MKSNTQSDTCWTKIRATISRAVRLSLSLWITHPLRRRGASSAESSTSSSHPKVTQTMISNRSSQIKYMDIFFSSFSTHLHSLNGKRSMKGRKNINVLFNSTHYVKKTTNIWSSWMILSLLIEKIDSTSIKKHRHNYQINHLRLNPVYECFYILLHYVIDNIIMFIIIFSPFILNKLRFHILYIPELFSI